MPVELDLEMKAMEAYRQAIVAVRTARSAYEAAGMTVPDRVLAFLGEAPAPAAISEAKLVIPAPQPPPRPPEAGPRWLWVRASEMTVVGLVKAVLRASGQAMPRESVLAEVQRIRAETNSGSVANVGTRLAEDGVIQRGSGGWSLRDPSTAPVLYEGYGWGELGMLESYEVAAYRRACLLHVLRLQQDGLQPAQLLKQMEQCSWLLTQVSKDLVKMDLETLDGLGKAKRVGGGSGKWKAVAINGSDT